MAGKECDGEGCTNIIDVTSTATFPDGAGGIEIHVKDGAQFMKYQGAICKTCVAKVMAFFKKAPPQSKDH